MIETVIACVFLTTDADASRAKTRVLDSQVRSDSAYTAVLNNIEQTDRSEDKINGTLQAKKFTFSQTHSNFFNIIIVERLNIGY